jgi:hypothetical protein
MAIALYMDVHVPQAITEQLSIFPSSQWDRGFF